MYGIGANNIGQLIKSAGKITRILSTHMWVDDGSRIADIGGRMGVMTRVISTSGYSVGDMISMVGIVQGSVPTGWTANRRYVCARTVDDVRKL